ncbi:aldehyde dehydrogenase family protein [Methylacidiphilum caldifontis]|uniref:Betaine-aldehyde dehydrogenase n=1 Tax=Methylacidiphilum caldifontis TaxID=2795386 RepID=A0A4Y8PFN7_9BACT|nr:aldehyde dehydrogenase family protein [Methylacidiphilum caldifontis]QSR88378.1 aldehyde dehydrogenase family protein [Methylacidiphilum caldifontis]TFE70680.1 betaine-aldehyde dehydrogenase [Methylacidiphilum caldifontis]
MLTANSITKSESSSYTLLPKVQKFLKTPKKLFIGGRWVDAVSGKTFPTYDPASGEVLAYVAEADKEDVDKAVKAAREAFENGPWAKMSPAERAKLIWKLADLIEENLEELAQIESLDNGKPMAVAKVADLPLSIDLFRYMAGWATKIEGNTIPFSLASPEKFVAYTRREPIGVVGQIIPWNFPLLMAAWKLGPALATGCTVILKPAEQTPLSALWIGELIQQAGFPDGVVNILPGFGETAGAAIAAHGDIDKVAFTGSTEVGKIIVKAATSNLKKVSLELGGKSPNIVFSDADLSVAIPGAASAIFFNHGQCCCAGSRLYVEKKAFDKVLEGITEEAKKIRLGPGLDPSTEMGPLVSQEQYDRVFSYIRSGLDEGATVVTGGKRFGERGYFISPTIFSGVNSSMKIVNEEIFGPVVCAIPFEDTEEIAPVANQTIYGLAAGIWTKDISKAHRLAAKLKAGTVWINCYNVFDASLPFGGYKQSGWGREMGHAVLDNYLETKSVCIQID